MRRFSVHRFSGLLLVAGVLSLLPCVGGLPAAPDKPVGGDGPQGKAPTETDPDEVLLRQAKVGTDDASLLDFLRKRSATDADLLNVEKFIRQLGDATQAKREEASQKLTALGLVVLPSLRQAQKDADKEIVQRANLCIETICRETNWSLPAAAVRLLLKRKPAGTAEAIVRYLPYIGDEGTEEEVWFALDTLATNDAKVLTILRAALADGFAARRAAVACILGRLGNDTDKAAVRPILADKDPLVRLRAAQGLLAGKDKAAIPVLISLLDEPAVEISWQAEDLLHWAAWEDAPAATVGAATAEERQKCREAWQAWWQKQGAALDLGKMAAEPRVPRLLLVVDSEVTGNYPNRTVVNRVSLCGCDGQPRWMFKGAPFPERKALRDARGPYFAQLVPGNRVLIDDGVRDLQGKLVWKSQWVDTLLTARRLPTGNFFFASSMHVEEVTPDNQLLYSFRQEDHRRSNLFRFSPGWVDRLPNGDLRSITIDPDREVHVCEFQGHPRKELSRVRLTIDPGPYWQCETLPNLHYLLSSSSKNIVWELSADGQICRERRLRYLLSSHLLPNGNLLVHGGPIGMPMEYGQAVLEIDRQDKVHTEVLLLATGIERIQVCLGLVSFGFGRSPQPTEDLLTSVPYQIKKLKSRDSRVRQSACAALSELGRKAEAAVPLLLEMLTGEDKELANSASGVLLKVAGPTACPEAGKLLKHARPDVRWTAVHILSNNWPASKEFFPQIVEKLKDEDASVREAAVWMFGLIGGRDEKEVISHLVQAALEDKEDIVRCYAVQALGKIGPDAKSSVPALLKLLKGDNLYLRAPASAALAAIAPEKTEVIEALVDALQDKDEVLRFRVAMVLGTLGSAPKNVVSALREAARTDPDKQVREKAEEAMRKIQGKK